jgi:hypothetical protein
MIEIKGSLNDIGSQVDFRLDITGPRAARTEIDWNSKRAGESRIWEKTFPLMRFIRR